MYALGIEVHEDDESHLREMCDAMGSTYAINPSSRCNTVITKIYDQAICHQLMDLGIMPRKSLKLDWVDIDEKYLQHFVRGYFDGDGCFHSRWRDSYWDISASICGTHAFNRNVMDRVTKILDIPETKIRVLENGVTSQMAFYGRNAMRFCKWMYEDGGIRLQRKYDKWLSQRKLQNSK